VPFGHHSGSGNAALPREKDFPMKRFMLILACGIMIAGSGCCWHNGFGGGGCGQSYGGGYGGGGCGPGGCGYGAYAPNGQNAYAPVGQTAYGQSINQGAFYTGNQYQAALPGYGQAATLPVNPYPAY